MQNCSPARPQLTFLYQHCSSSSAQSWHPCTYLYDALLCLNEYMHWYTCTEQSIHTYTLIWRAPTHIILRLSPYCCMEAKGLAVKPPVWQWHQPAIPLPRAMLLSLVPLSCSPSSCTCELLYGRCRYLQSHPMWPHTTVNRHKVIGATHEPSDCGHSSTCSYFQTQVGWCLYTQRLLLAPFRKPLQVRADGDPTGKSLGIHPGPGQSLWSPCSVSRGSCSSRVKPWPTDHVTSNT